MQRRARAKVPDAADIHAAAGRVLLPARAELPVASPVRAMPSPTDSTSALLGSPWVAALGLLLAALGLAKAAWAGAPDVRLAALGLFLVALSAHSRTPDGRTARRRTLEAVMLALLAVQLAAAFA